MSTPALPALPPARCSPELDSDSLSGSLSDSDFVSASSTPPTVDTAATSDDDEQQQHPSREPKRMSDAQLRPPSCPQQPRQQPRRTSSSSTKPYLTCSSSLLRTTLFAFARIGLGSSTTTTTTPASPSSSSRRSSLSYPSSTGSPIEPPSLHAKSTVEICTNSNPSLAQFSPTPPASSSLAIYAPHSSHGSSTSRRHALRSRSASSVRHQHAHNTAHTAHSGVRTRTHSLAFRASADADNDVTSPRHQDSVTSPGRFAAFWRKQQPLAQNVRDENSSPALSALTLPSISRAHVPDLVLPISVDGASDHLPAASTAAEDGFLKIDGSRDGLSFRTAENGNGATFFLGTPRPSYPISQAPEYDDLTVVVDSPVANEDDGLPKFEWKGKGKERATIPNEFYAPAPSASIPIPTSPTTQVQTPQRRIKIVLPPPPVRASTTPMLRQPRPVATAALAPPTLAKVEQTSRLMRDQAHCATCAAVGVDFPRCPRCAETWCSRECRVARMDELADGRRKHVCKT